MNGDSKTDNKLDRKHANSDNSIHLIRSRKRHLIGTTGSVGLCSDILFEVVLFLNTVALFRLGTTNRRFYNFCSKSPFLKFLYEKGVRVVQNICIRANGFSVCNQISPFASFEDLSWTPVPTPIYPIPLDKIEGFHNIFILLPFSTVNIPDQEKSVQITVKIKDVNSFFDAIFTDLPAISYSLCISTPFEEGNESQTANFLALMGLLNAKYFRNIDVVNNFYLDALPEQFWRSDAFLRTSHLNVNLVITEGNDLAIFNALFKWLSHSSTFNDLKNGSNHAYTPEKTLMLNFYEDDYFPHSHNEFMIYLIGEFVSSQSPAPFIVLFYGHSQLVPDFCIKNDITGELLTWGTVVDAHGQLGTPDGALFIRRRPQIGPHRPVDLSAFEDEEQAIIRIE